MATRNISIESQVILKHRQMIVDRIAKSAGALWLSQKLQQEDFISPERAAAILNTLGISNCDKVSQMMEAVESKIKYDPSRFFGRFVEIVESEPALKDVCKALNDCYQDKLCVALKTQPPPQDEEDDSDLEKDLEGQKLLPRRERKDKHGKNYQQLKTEGVVTIQNGKEQGQPCIQCNNHCVCCTVATVSVVAAMTTAFIALNHDDSDIGRFRRSSEYPEDRKALSTRTVFDFLWITSPTSLMFAVAITTYCTCTRPSLKQMHWFHFYNLMAICFYGVTMLLLLVWKPLKVARRYMSADDLAFLYTMYNSFFFSIAAVFVLPGPGKKSWKVIRVSIAGAAVLFVYIVWFYAYMTDTNAAPLSSQLTASFVSAGIFLAAFMEVVFTFRTLSLSRIATLTEAKRYVLFVIILLLYTGYCISGIYEGLVREAAVVLVTMLSFGFSTILKYFWEQVSGR